MKINNSDLGPHSAPRVKPGRRTRAERLELERNRHRDARLRLIAHLGGKCAVCGTTEHLQFDHIDPAQKSFEIGNRKLRPLEELLPELAKCQLLCRQHHAEKTAQETRVRAMERQLRRYQEGE